MASGLVAAPIPGHIVKSIPGEGLTPLIIMALVGTPIYACSTGSIPLIAALVERGDEPSYRPSTTHSWLNHPRVEDCRPLRVLDYRPIDSLRLRPERGWVIGEVAFIAFIALVAYVKLRGCLDVGL